MPGDWWGEMSVLQRVYGCIGIPVILVLIVWLALSIIRMLKENKEIFSGNYDIEDRRYFWPIHYILIGLAISSWVGFFLCFAEDRFSHNIIIFISIITFVFYTCFTGFIAKIVSKRRKVFKTNLKDIVGMTCEVKHTIPEHAHHKGNIILNIEGEKLEIDAVSYKNSPLKKGNTAKIIGLLNENTVIVE